MPLSAFRIYSIHSRVKYSLIAASAVRIRSLRSIRRVRCKKRTGHALTRAARAPAMEPDEVEMILSPVESPLRSERKRTGVIESARTNTLVRQSVSSWYLVDEAIQINRLGSPSGETGSILRIECSLLRQRNFHEASMHQILSRDRISTDLCRQKLERNCRRIVRSAPNSNCNARPDYAVDFSSS